MGGMEDRGVLLHRRIPCHCGPVNRGNYDNQRAALDIMDRPLCILGSLNPHPGPVLRLSSDEAVTEKVIPNMATLILPNAQTTPRSPEFQSTSSSTRLRSLSQSRRIRHKEILSSQVSSSLESLFRRNNLYTKLQRIYAQLI